MPSDNVTMPLPPEIAAFLERGGALRMLADIDEKYLRILYSYACQCVEQGDVATAERLLQVLFRLDLWNFDYALSLGLCLQMRGAHRQALFCFMRAAMAASADPRPSYYAALSYQKLGNVEYAKRAFTLTLRLASDQPAYEELRNQAERALQDFERRNA